MQIFHSMCTSDTGIVVITIYVGDIFIVGDNDVEMDNVKDLLKKEFEMKDLRELCYFLCI